MSSQLVDINADGINDILVGSFEGVPQIIEGSKKGFLEPKQITDADGETVLIRDFWNYETKEWDKTDRAKSEGHCTSVSAVDWDGDGDLDLLLGDYYGGRLFLRLNEGTKEKPAFAKHNEAVVADGKPVVIEHGLAAPRIVDWNGDGRFDILCGGAKGGVYFFQNTSKMGAPKFAASSTVIEPVKDPSNSFIRRVPAKNGEPTLPGSSYHIEPFDFDGDGDLDLLVGARSSWLKDNIRKLTDEEKEQAAKIKDEMATVMAELRKIMETAKTDLERKEMIASEEYKKVVKRYTELATESQKYKSDPTESGDFVWLYRRK